MELSRLRLRRKSLVGRRVEFVQQLSFRRHYKWSHLFTIVAFPINIDLGVAR
jgi:hypothetical protein